jgi:hypothetical protein
MSALPKNQGQSSLEAVNPLYGKAYVEQTGRFVIGATRVKDGAFANRLVEQVRERIGR